MTDTFDTVIIHLDDDIMPSDHFQFMAWKTLFSEMGVPFDKATYHEMNGKIGIEGLNFVLSKYNETRFADVVKDGFALKQTLLYRAYLSSMRMEDLTSRAQTLIPKLKENGKRLYAYTLDKNAEIVLDKTGLWKYFDGFVDRNINPDGDIDDVFEKLSEAVLDEGTNVLLIMKKGGYLPNSFVNKVHPTILEISEVCKEELD